MSTFNIGSLTSNSNTRALSPWGIYNVTLTNADIVSFKGKKDPTRTFYAVSIRFDSPQGYYEHKIFYPTDETRDNTRPTFRTKNGGTMKRPSSNEEAMSLISQIVMALAPKSYNLILKDFDTFDALAKTVVSILKEVVGTSTQIKLEGYNVQNKVYSRFPRVASIDQSGNLRMSDTVIGNGLEMNKYQSDKAKDYQSQPTTMEPPTIRPQVTPQEPDLDALMI